jgi:hypothetical protein
MTTRRKIWAGLTLFVVVLFTVILPVHIYDRHPILFAFLGSGLLALTLGQTLGDFDSVYELFEKEDTNVPQPAGRRLVPFVIIPGIVFAIVLIFYNGGRKDDELAAFGMVTKGVIENGSSTTTTRRFQQNTSYDLIFSYKDSTGAKYVFEQSVNGSDFNDAYRGQEVDIVYSRKNPDLAKAVLNLDELASYKKIANNPIEVQQLISILESDRPDTIVNYLNNINYQWVQANDGVYSNEKRNLVIKVFPGNEEVAFVDNSTAGYGLSNKNSDFEKSLETFGFKKKAITENNETQELYYTEKYGVSKENKMIEPEGNSIGFTMVTVYHVFHMSSLAE